MVSLWKKRINSRFSVHKTPEELKTVTITGHFGFMFRGNSVREIIRLPWGHRFRKSPFSLKCFPLMKKKKKRRANVFKFFRFEERFRKAPFSWRISVDGRPNRTNKAVFSKFFGVVGLRCLTWQKYMDLFRESGVCSLYHFLSGHRDIIDKPIKYLKIHTIGRLANTKSW